MKVLKLLKAMGLSLLLMVFVIWFAVTALRHPMIILCGVIIIGFLILTFIFYINL